MNLAVLIDGSRPIGARARRTTALTVRMNDLSDGDGKTPTLLSTLSDMANSTEPLSRGAIVKAVLVILGIVDPASPEELPEQLEKVMPIYTRARQRSPIHSHRARLWPP